MLFLVPHRSSFLLLLLLLLLPIICTTSRCDKLKTRVDECLKNSFTPEGCIANPNLPPIKARLQRKCQRMDDKLLMQCPDHTRSCTPALLGGYFPVHVEDTDIQEIVQELVALLKTPGKVVVVGPVIEAEKQVTSSLHYHLTLMLGLSEVEQCVDWAGGDGQVDWRRCPGSLGYFGVWVVRLPSGELIYKTFTAILNDDEISDAMNNFIATK